MKPFHYSNGQLQVEQVALAEIAQSVGTPAYVYSASALEENYRRFHGALVAEGLDPLVCYAVKANSNQAVVSTFAALGAGADVVSQGEVRRALTAGIPARKIVFAGVGKTRDEMAFALSQGIRQFNVESLPELEALSAVANAMGREASVALRVNPDVDARTLEKISTGKAENKFGIAFDQAPEAAARTRALPGLKLTGLAVHIGSQLTDLAPYRAAFHRLGELYRALRTEGHPLEHLDLGGGLGIVYRDEQPPPVEAYAKMVREATEGLDARLVFEPGRHLVGNAGVFMTSVVHVKRATSRSFVIVDGAMNDLIRPTLYEAWHDILPIAEPAADAPAERYDIVGPICESTDWFAKQRPLPPLETGDVLAFLTSGAYCAVMASNYNSRPLVPEVLVKDGAFFVIRPRQDYATLIALDRLPPWLSAADERAAGSGG